MRNRDRQKGVALLVVSGIALVFFAAVMGLLFVLDANIRSLESVKEHTVAYYLCETGASKFITEISNGNIGYGTNPTSGVKQWTQKTFDYVMGTKTYHIKYTVSKATGVWDIVSEVGQSSGFSRTYKLRVRGRRAFPIFIRGFAGK